MQDRIRMFFDQLASDGGAYAPRVLAALGILVGGWLVALLVQTVVRKALKRTTIDNRIAVWVAGDQVANDIKAELWVARGAFYVIMLFVLMAVFQALKLTVLTEPLDQLLGQLLEYAPRLLGAAALLLVAWAVATGLRLLLTRLLSASRLEERLRTELGKGDAEYGPLSKTLGEAVYWLVFALFLPAVLGALRLEGLLGPVQSMLDKTLSFLPNLAGAGAILLVGWFMARVVQRILSNLLAAVGTDGFSERTGLGALLGGLKLSSLIGHLAYALILLSVLIASLNALALDAVTQPASNMLNSILAAVPAIFTAMLVLTIAYFVGRVVSGLVANLLAGFGFNALPQKLGFRAQGESARTPSDVAGTLLLVGVMLFAAIEAAGLLGFASLAALLSGFTVFAGHVVLALVIFTLGLWISNLVAAAIKSSGAGQSSMLSGAARVAILALTGAMALRQMGIADDIINLAFGLLLGAIAVAIALAFGLGSREIAAREVQGWINSVRPAGRDKADKA